MISGTMYDQTAAQIEALMRATLPPVRARRAIRLAAGVSQVELAEVLGVSRWSVLRWEAGTHEPVGDTKRLYAEALRTMARANV